jgi:hypothetical protein
MRGYILIEASVVYTILALALTALVPLFILCYRSSQETAHIATATLLASELLEEIQVRKWDQRTPIPAQAIDSPSPTLGPDPGETPGDKSSFNDVDDFEHWAEAQPLGPMMEPIKGLESYNRSVEVDYVSPDHPDAVSTTPTDYKRVTVCAQWKQARPICLQTLLTNH